MNKRTSLENLVFQSGLTYKEFADKVGVNSRTFEKQMQNKSKHILLAFEYAKKLGVNTIKGYENDVYFELDIKL